MHYYYLYGQNIMSDIEIPRLIRKKEHDFMPDIKIMCGDFYGEYKREEECYSQLDRHMAYFSNSYCYIWAVDGKELFYQIKNDAGFDRICAFLLGWGMAMIGYQQGKPAIHCSCVADERGAVLICGYSGSGKSTATDYLLKSGYSILADDMTLIEFTDDGRALATPGFPYRKLCGDVLSDKGYDARIFERLEDSKGKYLIPCDDIFEYRKVPVRAMVLLFAGICKGVCAGRVNGGDKLRACVDSLFLKCLFEDNSNKEDTMKSCLKLASALDIYWIERNGSVDTKDEMGKVLHDLLER